MQASRSNPMDRVQNLIESPDGAVSFAWDVVKRHPLASLGAVAAGVGAYVVLRHFEADSKGNGRSKSRENGVKKAALTKGKRSAPRGRSGSARAGRAPRPVRPTATS